MGEKSCATCKTGQHAWGNANWGNMHPPQCRICNETTGVYHAGWEPCPEVEKFCSLPTAYWRRILNLLNEELEVWDEKSIEHDMLTDSIFLIEKQTDIRKKPRPEVEKPDPKDDPLIRKLKEPSEDIQYDI